MKFLLINPPIRENDKPNDFPSGLGYIAAMLLKHGYDVTVLDINAWRYKKETVIRLLQKYLIDKDINIVGIGCLITCYNYVKWIIKVIKNIKKQTIVIVGGGLGTSIPEMVIEKLRADIVVIGEGEYTILELMEIFKKPQKKNLKKKLLKVKGICFKYKGKIIKTQAREFIKNLDEIPFPAWDLFPIHIYLKNLWGEIKDMGIKSKSSMNVVSGRGCPYHCTFCYDPLGHIRRIRSVDNVIQEIKLLKRKYGVDFIFFGDPIFMTSKEWVMQLCDRIIRENIKIKWASAGRVNLVDLELLKKMRDAGCISVNFGIESGSQKMLDIMRKGITVEQASKAIRIVRKVGMNLWTSFMMGFPEETRETLEETIRFCIDNDIHLVTIFFVTPYPGTALYEQVKRMGLIKNEEEYISKLGDATELTINLTKWSDDELIRLREYVIHKVGNAYFKKHKLEYFSWLVKKQKWYLNYIRTRGLHALLNEAKKKAASIIVR